MRKSALCALVLLMGPLLACGGGDDDNSAVAGDSGGDLTFAEWQVELNAVCADFEVQLAEAEAAQPEASTSDELVAQIDELIPLNRKYLESLLAVDAPSERTAEVEQLYDDLRDQMKLALQIRQIIDSDGTNAAQPVVEQAVTSTEELDQTAEDMGLPECVTR